MRRLSPCPLPSRELAKHHRTLGNARPPGPKSPWRRTSTLAIHLAAFAIGIEWTQSVGLAQTLLVPVEASIPGATAVGRSEVTGRTGAATYSYKFTLPPARGVGPELVLVYSSSLLEGGAIASGWSLPMPSIRRDVFLERERGEVKYVANFGGHAEELVPFPSDPVSGGTATAYRQRVDRGLFRLERIATVDVQYWYAYTPSGMTYRFDQILPDEWQLASASDRWNNEVRYTYVGVTWAGRLVDTQLTRIEYTFNDAAAITSHALVEFLYSAGAPCAAGALPVGSHVDYSTGNRRIRSLKRLDAVVAWGFRLDDELMQPVRRWNLEYEAVDCHATRSPRRLLAAIHEVAIGRRGDTVAATEEAP
jgi:hypothetical protein